jgi:spore germination protein
MICLYQRLTAVLFPIIALLLVGTTIWGYQEHREKNSLLVKAENQYQRAFHDLSFHMDKVYEELGNTLAVHSTSNFHRKGFINLWRLTSEAQSEVNQLPLTLMPFHETEELLANVTKFSYNTAVRDLHKNPLSTSELKLLQTLYDKAKEIRNDLRKVQDAVISNQLKWMDVETLLATGNQDVDNDIIDGFRTMNKRVIGYSDMDWGPSVITMNQRQTMQSLSGAMVNEDQVRKLAAQFLGLTNDQQLQIVENGTDSVMKTYSITWEKTKNEVIQLEYTKKGGKLIYFLATRDVPARKIKKMQSIEFAQRFLTKHGYQHMAPVGLEENDNTATLTFAKRIGGITYYPAKCTIKIALDNGEVTGLSTRELLYVQSTPQNKLPGISESQAKKFLNPDFQINQVSLAVVINDLQQEVLCYEFSGSIHGDDYRIYLNADHGFEEKIEHLQDAIAS